MTREEAKKECQIYIKKISEWYMDIGNHPKKTSTDILDEIYDDFESRKCENCKWYYEPRKNCKYGYCKKLLDDEEFRVDDKDFGCSKFEKIEL